MVGAADDHAEVDADRRADAALARLSPSDAHPHPHGVRRSAGATSGAIGLAGGALDGDTEQRLSSRLGRGGALDASLRRRMEGGFGRSFSDVHVHTDGEADALSRQMSATAFTVGKDMFFSKGAYRPGDESGDRLIAHELAHVTQAGEGAHRRVHRAVGFEFETNVVVKQTVTEGPRAQGDAGSPLDFVPFGKASVLKRYRRGLPDGGGREQRAGGGDGIEFVVDPPVSERAAFEAHQDHGGDALRGRGARSPRGSRASTSPSPTAASVPDRRFGDRSIRQDAWYVAGPDRDRQSPRSPVASTSPRCPR